jgi:hypothetical protein
VINGNDGSGNDIVNGGGGKDTLLGDGNDDALDRFAHTG